MSKETQRQLQKRPTYSFSLIPYMRKQRQMPPRAQRSRRRRKHLSYPRCSVTKYMSKEAYKKDLQTRPQKTFTQEQKNKRNGKMPPRSTRRQNHFSYSRAKKHLSYFMSPISLLFAQQCGPICRCVRSGCETQTAKRDIQIRPGAKPRERKREREKEIEREREGASVYV